MTAADELQFKSSYEWNEITGLTVESVMAIHTDKERSHGLIGLVLSDGRFVTKYIRNSSTVETSNAIGKVLNVEVWESDVTHGTPYVFIELEGGGRITFITHYPLWRWMVCPVYPEAHWIHV